MKRFASHYLYIPETGFLKQYVIELEGSRVVHLFPLTEELESVVWIPGVIELRKEKEENFFSAYILYPFDFKKMLPVAETLRRQLL